MTVVSHSLASGPGWQAADVVCTSGPQNPPFEEQHATTCIALVISGTFAYRTRQGDALLSPGALLLGNSGACFECGHEHSAGDRCLSFHVTPRFHEAVKAAIPGTGKIEFARAALPPLPELAPLAAEAEVALEHRDVGALEEIGLRLTGAALALLAGTPPLLASPTARDARRIAEALQFIQTRAHDRLSLARLAAQVRMSRFHFLRTFRQIIGMTPHQYILHLRLHRAATRLRQTDDPVSAIALECGFEDLSTFNRRFRKAMGVNPGLWRAQ